MTDDRGPILELRSAEKHGNGSSSGTFYKIEVRTSYPSPTVIGEARRPIPFIIDHYWRELPIQRGATEWGVNIPVRPWDGHALDKGLCSYIVAEAHRWAFLAALEVGGGSTLCVETRLVAVELKEEYSLKEVGVTASEGHRYKPPELGQRQKPQ